MNRVAGILLNFMRIEVLLGIGLVIWVISLDANAQSDGCPLTTEESEALRYQAIALEAGKYEAALRKCRDRVPLTAYERMLNRTASTYLSSLSPDAEHMGKELQLAAETEAQHAREAMKAFVEETEQLSKLANDFSALAENQFRIHEANAVLETSTVRATTAELRLLNQLMLLMIEQNDKMLRYMEEQKRNQ